MFEPERRRGRSEERPDRSTIQESILRNDNRRAIVEELRQTPGLNKNQLCKRLDMLPNLVEFHLERLEDARLVVTKPSAQGREVLCFLAEDRELWEDEDTRILFGRRRTREIAFYIAENPGTTTAEIADQTGLAKVTVRHHLRTLRDHTIVERLRLGRRFEYHPSEELEAWIDEVGDRFEGSVGTFDGE